MIDLDKQLQEIVNKNNILKNEPMSKHTSLKIGGNADYFVKLQELRTAVQTLRQQAEGKIHTDIAAFDRELGQWKAQKDCLQAQREHIIRIWKNHGRLE